jgi:hypothetical protein
MGRSISKQGLAHAPREAEQQCDVRDANEAVSVLQLALAGCGERLALRCECGDAACTAHLSLTRGEYEAVRAHGSHFAVGLNHENPENACVLSENTYFEVIDVIAGDSRYHVLARNPRHLWIERSAP